MMVIFRLVVALMAITLSMSSQGSPLSKSEILKLLRSGRSLSGMHDTLGSSQVTGYSDIGIACNVTPRIWSGDFGFSVSKADAVDDIEKRGDQLEKMIALGKQGRILTLSWHQCNPSMGEPCTFKDGVQTPLTDAQWQSLMIPGSPMHQGWEESIAPLAATIKVLEDNGVVLLLRPYHEMNQPGMWWANRDPQPSIYLYRMLHDRLTYFYRLKNIIWVWSIAYHPTYWKNWKRYYPGRNYVDIVGLDIYPKKRGVEPAYGDYLAEIISFAPDKIVALTEVSRLPSAAELHSGSFSYAIPWGIDMLRRDNSEEEICKFFGSEN